MRRLMKRRIKNYSLMFIVIRYRILMLGDSFTEGVDVEDSVPKQLEKMLNEEGYDIEVINAGIGSYSPLLEYLYFKNEGILLNPNLVILNLDLTDITDDINYENLSVRDEKGEIIAVPGKKEKERRDVETFFARYKLNTGVLISRAWSRIRSFVMEGEEKNLYEEGKIETDPGFLVRFNLGEDYFLHVNKSFENIKEIKGECDKKGIRFILVTYPYAHQVNENEGKVWRKQKGFDEYPKYSLIFFDTIGELSDENNITYINTYYKFNNSKEYPLFYSKDVHMTKEGYRLMTEGIFEQMMINEEIVEELENARK